MKLITEEVSHVEFITEKVGKETKTFIQGVFLQGDICNRNGRMYPMETLAREVNRYNEAFIVRVVLLENSDIQMDLRSILTVFHIRLFP
jgi:hypothetical protein